MAGMECRTGEGEIRGAILPVAHKRVSQRGHVDTDLVCAPRVEAETKECAVFARLQDFVFCAAGKTVRVDGACCAAERMAGNGLIDDAAGRMYDPLGHGKIFPLETLGVKEPAKTIVSVTVFCDG